MNSRKENPNWFVDKLTLYQAANSTPEAIRRNFLIRLPEFELIISDLRNKDYHDPVQHELVLGRRGSGKSTLLRRIQVEIDEDAALSKQYIAINLAEEQHAIYRLSDLWFEVLQELKIRLENQEKLRDFDDFEDNQDYTRYLYAEIHRLLQSSGKKAVLLLDNLDRILENFNDDGHLLRETLLNYQDIQLIGASTRMDEHFWRYDQPFYEFFRRHRLEGLGFDDIHRLLNHWSAELKLPELQDYALRHRGRIEAIRILTDGLPRAILIFIQLLLHDSTLYGFDYLRKVMDLATPIYQERLGHLTPPQRKIVQEMAFEWKAAPTKVLVEKCRMESKLIASYLKQLERFGIVETIQTNTKNNLYRLAERFFNMWLIVTQGNPDQKRRARYLTLFLEAWYDGEELKALAIRHLGDLMAKNVTYDKAIVLSKALSQSQFIGVVERDALIEYTRNLAEESQVQYGELPLKFTELLDEIDQLRLHNKFEEALKKVEEIENEGDGEKFFLKGYCFKNLNKASEAEKNYSLAIEKGHVGALNNLAILYYENNQNPELALGYTRQAHKIFQSELTLRTVILIEIWNGIFDNLPEKIEQVFQSIESSDGGGFLIHLLYHQQKHLVLSFFKSEAHGKMLRERYVLIYLVTLILANKTEDNLLLKIPPEVMPTVEAILEDVKEKQAFYAQR